VFGVSSEDLKRIIREDLMSMITEAGLLDEFIAWLRSKMGGHIDPIKIDSIDIRYMVEFLREKNILSGDPLPPDLDIDSRLEEEVERSLKNTKEKRTRKYKPT
jgi:hypothetical protein